MTSLRTSGSKGNKREIVVYFFSWVKSFVWKCAGGSLRQKRVKDRLFRVRRIEEMSLLSPLAFSSVCSKYSWFFLLLAKITLPNPWKFLDSNISHPFVLYVLYRCLNPYAFSVSLFHCAFVFSVQHMLWFASGVESGGKQSRASIDGVGGELARSVLNTQQKLRKLHQFQKNLSKKSFS